jgi:addiction module HigA family antidote
MLREDFMPDYGLTVAGLAGALRVSRQTVNELIRERRAVSPEMALRLSRLFDNSAEFWLNAQRAVDLWDAARTAGPEIEQIPQGQVTVKENEVPYGPEEVRRDSASLNTALGLFDDAQEQIKKSIRGMPAKTVLKAVEAHNRQFPHSFSLELSALQSLLAASIKPLPDMRQVLKQNVDSTWLHQAVNHINTQLSSSTILGRVTPQGSRSEKEETPIEEHINSHIKEVISGDARDAFRAIQFVIVLLDKAAGDPIPFLRLKDCKFTKRPAEFAQKLGFENVLPIPPSGDGGRDIVATKSVQGMRTLFAFACKGYAPDYPLVPVTSRALLGPTVNKKEGAAKGIAVTASYFSPGARQYLLTELDLDGREFDAVVEWLHEYGSKSDT